MYDVITEKIDFIERNKNFKCTYKINEKKNLHLITLF